MKTLLRNQGRVAMMRLGRSGGSRLHRRLLTLYRYVEIAHWSQEALGGVPKHFATRNELFAEAKRHVRGASPLYLEFGVYEGDSLRWWSEHLQAPGARFVGFDSFEGLPEDWNEYRKAGTFAVERIPEFSDTRVSLEVGWFDKTVPAFDLPEHDQLIVNVDSDLYSSAVLVLRELEDHLVPGTLVYFDEFSDLDHELRAWREFLARTPIRVEALGMADGGTCWLFRVTD